MNHHPTYEPATLATCEAEPIHVTGAIQPHGLLIAIDEDERVVVAARNTEEMLGLPLTKVQGRALAEVVGDEAVAAVRQAVADDDRAVVRRVAVPTGGRLALGPVDLVAHRSGERVVVELEPVGKGPAVTYRTARAAVARLAATHTVDELCDQLVLEIRELTGFDRAMVYRFDEEWNGEVVAEARRDDLEPFLGLHYPAGDIPAQARQLYTQSWSRLIADVGYQPVHLDPVVDPGTGRPLDLSHSALRSVSPIHLTYLRNMGVNASMSISLLVDGVLWGMVACHHYAGPRHVGAEMRNAAEFVGQVASQFVADRLHSDQRVAGLVAEHEVAGIVAALGADSRPVHEAIVDNPALLTLVDAQGVAVGGRGIVRTAGVVPDESDVRRVAAALRRPGRDVVAADRLSLLDPELGRLADVAAGAMLVGAGTDDWVVWFRPAQEHVVDWAGDPRGKRETDSDDSAPLTPRSSFDRWREVVRDRSLPWMPWQRAAAERLQDRVSRELVRRTREHTAVAESLQRVLVPEETPYVPGFEVAARYRPSADIQLGGDWFDVFGLPDGRVAIAVGDVSGHGVEATAAMAQLRTALRAYQFEGHAPGDVLDKLDLFVSETIPGLTATVVLAVVTPGSAHVEVANAGHVPLLVIGPDQRCREVNAGRPLLGVGVGHALTEKLDLGDEELLVMFTDGLVERRGEPIDESLAALPAAAPDVVDLLDLGSWVDGLLATAPQDSDDDMTVVAVRRSHGEVVGGPTGAMGADR